MRTFLTRALVCAALSSVVILSSSIALAHENRGVGDHEVVVGWASEPAVSGYLNAVQLIVTHGKDPVTGLKMDVEVTFGDKTFPKTRLEPAFGSPGDYRASIVPSRAGVYTFHITGTIEGERFDEKFTASKKTFDEVTSAADLEFPEADPSRGELAERVTRLDPRLAAAATAAADADDRAGAATTLAIVALALSVLTLIGVPLIVRRSKG